MSYSFFVTFSVHMGEHWPKCYRMNADIVLIVTFVTSRVKK